MAAKNAEIGLGKIGVRGITVRSEPKRKNYGTVKIDLDDPALTSVETPRSLRRFLRREGSPHRVRHA